MRFYETDDPREAPMYSAAEAASYLAPLPSSTLRAWFQGTKGGFSRIFDPAESGPLRLSFFNLVEAYVLDALRAPNRRGSSLPTFPVPRVRQILRRLQKDGFGKHPLATEHFKTDGKAMFVAGAYGNALVDVESGQAVMLERLKVRLSDITYADGFAVSFRPRRADVTPADAQVVELSARRAFGRPVIVGTRVPVAEVASRSAAGDTVEELARDFGVDRQKVESALRWWGGGEARAA